MRYVVDASAALSALLHDGPARAALATAAVDTCHLADAEVTNAVRRLVAHHQLERDAAAPLLAVWARLGIRRHPMTALIPRAWQLRENASGYDAMYLALAEFLACPLLTADARLVGVPGIRCEVSVVTR